jgi:hypothetical protein
MSDSKIKLSITLEGEGACIERLAELIGRFFETTDRAPQIADNPEQIGKELARLIGGGDFTRKDYQRMGEDWIDELRRGLGDVSPRRKINGH